MSYQPSLSGSSVRSYRQLDSPPHQPPPSNFLQRIHTHTHLDPQQPEALVRNRSYEALASRELGRAEEGGEERRGLFESKGSGSQQKYTRELTIWQNQITKLMASELGLRTEKELLARQTRTLREEITYLNEKCEGLQLKVDQLFKDQARTAILEREYQHLLTELEQQRTNCRILHGSQPEHITHLPAKAERYLEEENRSSVDYNRLKAREQSKPSSRFNGRINQKVSWKKTSGSSPIYKLDQYRKPSGNRLEEVSLIQSKIDKIRGEETPEEREEEANRDHTKTIDLKDLERLKEYENSVRALSAQIREIRSKNILLYKRSEEFEQQRIKLLENINELNYDKSRLLSDQRAADSQHRRALELLSLDLETHKISIIELREALASKEEALRLASLEKAEIEEKMKRGEARQEGEQGRAISEMRQSLQKSEKELVALRQRWQGLTKRQEEMEIENKLQLHQMEDKKLRIAQLESQLDRLREAKHEKPISLQQESILSKTENIMQKQYRSQVKNKSTQTEEETNKLVEELKALREAYQKLMQEHNAWGFQQNKLKNHNTFLNENFLKLTQLYEQQKAENSRLKELDAEWRQIQAIARRMKKFDQTIDHLWQIKEVEYENVHQILQKINQT